MVFHKYLFFGCKNLTVNHHHYRASKKPSLGSVVKTTRSYHEKCWLHNVSPLAGRNKKTNTSRNQTEHRVTVYQQNGCVRHICQFTCMHLHRPLHDLRRGWDKSHWLLKNRVASGKSCGCGTWFCHNVIF